MKKSLQNTVLIVLVCMIISLIASNTRSQCCGTAKQDEQKAISPVEKQVESDAVSAEKNTNKDVSQKLPKMLELGSIRCKACKAMEPVLEELRKNYSEKLTVEFIDVMQNPEIGEKYKIEMIPTQIFLDLEGKEIFRHTGFFSRDEIVSKWKELGYELEQGK